MGGHRRFFVLPEQIQGGTARLDGGAARQICRVLRLKEGDRLTLLDGCGNEHDALITSVTKDAVEARVENTAVTSREPVLQLTLAVCLPKSDRMELVAQKCTELGISQYVIVDSERVVARPDARRLAERMERWRRIAAEAAEQCGRSRVPEFRGIIDLVRLAEMVAEYQLAVVAWEEETSIALRDVLRQAGPVASCLVIIGPEGGLSAAEVDLLTSAGAVRVSLGRRLLRTETAAIAACAAIMYELEGEL